MNSVEPIAFRLKRGKDLKLAVMEAVEEHQIKAGCVASVVGCLSAIRIRLADGTSELEAHGAYEVISLSGTLTPEHAHLHIAVADETGTVIGGHLLEGNIVSHTAEVCLLVFPQLSFGREYDESTGYTELVIK